MSDVTARAQGNGGGSISDPICICGAPLSRHCKANIEHSDYKDEMKQNGATPRTHVCKTRHCLDPLCCCVDFQEAAPTHFEFERNAYIDGLTLNDLRCAR